MSRYDAHLVATNEVEAWWSEAKPFVERALAHGTGRRTADDVKKDVLEGDSQLWLVYVIETSAIHASFVTEIIEYPRKRVLDMSLMAGAGLSEWLCLLPTLETWARRVAGCDQIQIHGRAGWGRVTSYPEVARVYVKELSDG